ncbi:uncharacterized protein LOC129918108 [Episyrphus balteatus]|uniref:uncharacterized protein LOC129918108 n=1 Tax=Episyrphus balteatus TaxID=286459 RepID=UPI002485DCA4|nr:uncharacterized protein LOC129918108 [Episyrphus balteatus]
MRNLKGLILPVLFGGEEPEVIISNESNGNRVIGGFLFNLLDTLAKKYNARLNTSRLTMSLSPYEIHLLVLNGTIEISAAGPLIIQVPDEWFLYPYSIFDWNVMLPVEQNIPVYKVFAHVFKWKAFVLIIVLLILISALVTVSAYIKGSNQHFHKFDFFFNIDCFRGILGGPFFQIPNASFTTKLIYSLIFLLGIMIVTSYDAFLQSFMTQPPKENIIRSFDDLQSTGMKINAFQADIDELLYKFRPQLMQKHSNLFQAINSFEDFIKIRDSLNTTNPFTITEPKWIIYANQQKFYGQQLYRWSEELCLLENILLVTSWTHYQVD